MRTLRWIFLWFVAGVVGVAGHQAVLAVLYEIGFAPLAPLPMRPVPPFGVPQVVSLAFWGGVWGIVLGLIAPLFGSGRRFWLLVFLFGAVAPTLVAVAVVMPLKGASPPSDPAPALVTALAINGAWGLVSAACRRVLGR